MDSFFPVRSLAFDNFEEKLWDSLCPGKRGAINRFSVIKKNTFSFLTIFVMISLFN